MNRTPRELRIWLAAIDGVQAICSRHALAAAIVVAAAVGGAFGVTLGMLVLR